MIIVAVLGVLAVVLIMVTNLSADASFATQLMATIREEDRAYYVARSAVNAVLPLLPGASDGAHTLRDAWAVGAPPLKIDGYIVQVRISDEERFINPNPMLDSGSTTNDDQVRVFRRLVKLLGQRDEEVTNAILDWMDADSDRRLPGGAEGSDYNQQVDGVNIERIPKNAPLDSVEEIAYVKGVPPELLGGSTLAGVPSPGISGLTQSPTPGRKLDSTGGGVKRGLREFISVYGTGIINVNTAPPLVLRTLADTLDQGLVNAIVERREREPFKKMDDLLDVPGLTRDHLYLMRKVASVRSTTWRVRADVAVDTGSTALEGPPQTTLIAIYRGRDTRPLAWTLEEVGSSREASPLP